MTNPRPTKAIATTSLVSKATGDGRRITGVEHEETIVFVTGSSIVDVEFIRVASSASRLFDVELFDKSDFAEGNSVFKSENNNRLMVRKEKFPYRDENTNDRIYVKITNKDIRNASTFTIKILGEALPSW